MTELYAHLSGGEMPPPSLVDAQKRFIEMNGEANATLGTMMATGDDNTEEEARGAEEPSQKSNENVDDVEVSGPGVLKLERFSSGSENTECGFIWWRDTVCNATGWEYWICRINGTGISYRTSCSNADANQGAVCAKTHAISMSVNFLCGDDADTSCSSAEGGPGADWTVPPGTYRWYVRTAVAPWWNFFQDVTFTADMSANTDFDRMDTVFMCRNH